MLREVVENINDPEKRKILLNFLDQSTIKTEYVTIKESSSSGEEIKGLRKVSKFSKRRRKSPVSVIPKTNLYRKRKNINAYSQERRRLSWARQTFKTVAGQEQNIQNFAIERKNGSDEFDSKNGDKCYTEESKEVPLEAILNKINNYQRPHQMRSRRQSGYSASRDEATHPGDNEIIIENFNFDLEAGPDQEQTKRPKNKEMIMLSEDMIDSANKNTGEMVNLKIIKKWTGILKSFIILFLVVALVAVTSRGIFLEIKQRSYTNQIHSLNKEVNELYKSNAEWKEKYNEWMWDHGSEPTNSSKNSTNSHPSDTAVYKVIRP